MEMYLATLTAGRILFADLTCPRVPVLLLLADGYIICVLWPFQQCFRFTITSLKCGRFLISDLKGTAKTYNGFQLIGFSYSLTFQSDT